MIVISLIPDNGRIVVASKDEYGVISVSEKSFFQAFDFLKVHKAKIQLILIENTADQLCGILMQMCNYLGITGLNYPLGNIMTKKDLKNVQFNRSRISQPVLKAVTLLNFRT